MGILHKKGSFILLKRVDKLHLLLYNRDVKKYVERENIK